jgi:uncharacterized protein YcbK (DUF882 family)
MTLTKEWPADAGFRWPNFSRVEVMCKCGCENVPDPVFLDTLQAIRQDLGFGLTVTSGARCPEYNARVSKTGRSGPHTTGMAADIGVMGGRAFELVSCAVEHGVTGLGIKQKGDHLGRFIHIDMLPTNTGKREWIWSY